MDLLTISDHSFNGSHSISDAECSSHKGATRRMTKDEAKNLLEREGHVIVADDEDRERNR